MHESIPFPLPAAALTLQIPIYSGTLSNGLPPVYGLAQLCNVLLAEGLPVSSLSDCMNIDGHTSKYANTKWGKHSYITCRARNSDHLLSSAVAEVHLCE